MCGEWYARYHAGSPQGTPLLRVARSAGSNRPRGRETLAAPKGSGRGLGKAGEVHGGANGVSVRRLSHVCRKGARRGEKDYLD